jgi:hypothetical protein
MPRSSAEALRPWQGMPVVHKQNAQSVRRNNFPGEQIPQWFLLLSENLSTSNYPGAALSAPCASGAERGPRAGFPEGGASLRRPPFWGRLFLSACESMHYIPSPLMGEGLGGGDQGRQARCPFHKYTASSGGLASFPRKRESRRQAHGDWMLAYAGMTFYWRRTYEMDI